MSENRDEELWEIYNKLDSDSTPAGYDWPAFIECDKEMSAGDMLAALQVALRAVVYCERNYRQDPDEMIHKTDEKFVFPFSIIYAVYAEHFKRYLPGEPVPSVKDVSRAYVKEIGDLDVHEASETKN